MFYEVTTPSGSSSIIEADNSIDAKKEFANRRRVTRPSGYYLRSLQTQKIKVDFPESVHRFDETSMAELEGKDVLIFDSHHGTAVRIRAASVESIQYFLDEYSTIIVL